VQGPSFELKAKKNFKYQVPNHKQSEIKLKAESRSELSVIPGETPVYAREHFALFHGASSYLGLFFVLR
jgi:hypothetical protein